MDFTLIVDEDDISEEEDYEYLLGSNQFLPEIEEVLKGVKAGEDKELTIKIPESHTELSLRGKEVKFLFHLKEVRGKQLPELNTEFFKGYGEEVNSEEDFIELLKQEIIRKKESENIAAYRSKIKEQLIKRLTFPVPDEIRKKEVEYQLSVLQQENDKKAVADKLPAVELEKQAEEAAGNHLRFLAYIEKMVKEFNLQVDEEEVKHKFAVNARMLGIDLNDQTQQERSNDFYYAFYQTVQENAVLDYLTNQILKK
jgi:trigger factor